MSDPARFHKVMALFDQACGLAPEARCDFLQRACGGDAVLQSEVEALLAHDDPSAGRDGPIAVLDQAGEGMFVLARAIEASPADESAKTSHVELADEEPFADRLASRSVMPVLAGHYRVIRVLGEGGMGIVYLAEQARPQRLVALKAIRPGMSSRQMLRRFEHEAQMLARLQHPGIAQIYEAGAPDEASHDQAYFAMEYVAGPPLHEYADGRALGVRERVQLMIRVCDAVQHAHQRGVIHRDLKPNNINVESSGQPKVLDFGVARAEAAGGDAHTTMHTQAGQLVGTLSYMSPEQVADDPDAVDTRSDVYALGVMLYQLLARRLPLEFGGSGLVEAARMIREVEPPRLGHIHRDLRGDLEVIVARAMEKDRDRRYQSAADLRDDLQRFLDGRPIVARQDSAIYVLRRTLRRHRPMVAAALLALAALVAFAAYTSMMATRNRDLALREGVAREEADKVSRSLERELAVSSIERGRMAGQTGSLVAAEQLLWSAYARDPRSRHVHWALWELYSRVSCRATHDTAVRNIAGMSVSPSGELIAFGGEPSRVEVRRMSDFALMHTLEVDGARCTAVAFSPDGSLLAAGDDRGAVIIWSVADMSRRCAAHATGSLMRNLTWRADGRQLAWAGGDLKLHVWTPCDEDAPVTHAPANVKPLPGASPQVEYAPDGRHFVWFGADEFVRFLPVDDPTRSAITLEGHTDRVFTVTFSGDGRTLYTGSNDRDIRRWDIASAKCTATLTAPNGLVRSLQISRNGRTLLSIGWWTLDTWNLESLTRTRVIPLPNGAFGTWWSPDEQTVLTGHSTGVVRAWDLRLPSFADYAGHAGRCAAAISRDGVLIAVGDGEGGVMVRDRESGSTLWSVNAHNRRVHALQFSPNGQMLLTGGADGMLRLWNARTGVMLRETMGVNATAIDAASFSNDGTRIVAAWSGAGYRVLNAADLSIIATFKHGPSEALCARFSDDDRFIATTAREKFVRVWSADGAPIAELPTIDAPWVARFSPDGRRIAVGTWGRTIELLDIASAGRAALLEGHNGLVSGVAYAAPTDGIVASAAADGTVRLWDVDDPRNVLILDAFEVEAITVDLSADGRWMIAASADGRIKVWDLRRFDAHVDGNREHNLRVLGSVATQR